MANVADYLVLQDGPQTLDPASAQAEDWHFERSFTLGPEVQLSGSMILQFVCVYPDSFTTAKVRLRLNGDTIIERVGPSQHGVHTGIPVGVHETFGATLAHHGPNQLRVELFGGAGRAVISDIVIWFQAQAA
jgi:hypothetical protein